MDQNNIQQEHLKEIETTTKTDKNNIFDLSQEALEVYNLLKDFDNDFNNLDTICFYVISSNWFRRWKRYTSYDNVIRGEEIDENWFGRAHPGKINEDIIWMPEKYAIYPNTNDFRNVFLRRNLQKGIDYEIITEATWEYFSERYENIPVKRYAYTKRDGSKSVEVELKQINLIPITSNFLSDMNNKQIQAFQIYLIQISSQVTFNQLTKDLAELCKSKLNEHWFKTSKIFAEDSFKGSFENLRFWQLDPAISPEHYFDRFKEACKLSSSYSYQVAFEGMYLEKEGSNKVEDANLTNEDYLFLEVRESSKAWLFYGDNAPVRVKCKFCAKFWDKLAIKCVCQKIAYCSQECRLRDKRFHRSSCEAEKEEYEIKQDL